MRGVIFLIVTAFVSSQLTAVNAVAQGNVRKAQSMLDALDDVSVTKSTPIVVVPMKQVHSLKSSPPPTPKPTTMRTTPLPPLPSKKKPACTTSTSQQLTNHQIVLQLRTIANSLEGIELLLEKMVFDMDT